MYKTQRFLEESEWRVYATPILGEANPNAISTRVETVRGVPQLIKAIKLADYSEYGVFGCEPNALLDHIIIGPAPDKERELYWQLFHYLMTNILKIENASDRIVFSDIPYRFQ
ncbi:MAG: hypothetical protein AAF429_03755 [Pseudomonadota bacterium]